MSTLHSGAGGGDGTQNYCHICGSYFSKASGGHGCTGAGGTQGVGETVIVSRAGARPMTQPCCDGECNHDDCCGKIPENCTHTQESWRLRFRVSFLPHPNSEYVATMLLIESFIAEEIIKAKGEVLDEIESECADDGSGIVCNCHIASSRLRSHLGKGENK